MDACYLRIASTHSCPHLCFLDYKEDPYSKGDPCNTICCRADLNSLNPSPAGCYDTKVAWLFVFFIVTITITIPPAPTPIQRQICKGFCGIKHNVSKHSLNSGFCFVLVVGPIAYLQVRTLPVTSKSHDLVMLQFPHL